MDLLLLSFTGSVVNYEILGLIKLNKDVKLFYQDWWWIQ